MDATRRGAVRPVSTIAVLLLIAGMMPLQLEAQAPVRATLRDSVAAVGGRVIVTFRPQGGGAAAMTKGEPAVSPWQAEAIASRLQSEGKIREPRRLDLLGGVAARVDEAGLAALLADPSVEMVEADAWIPLAEAADGPARMAADGTAQTIPWGVSRVTAPEAWGVVGKGAGVKVGIMDSGGDIDHPDLVWAGGYNAMSRSTSPSQWDDDISVCNGHGTHVAGTVAARDNDVGVVGVAPEVSLYALKVFQVGSDGKCGSYVSNQIVALMWADSMGIRVVNASLGGGTGVASYSIAINNAAARGTFLVAAAGNTGGSPVQYPAAYPGAISVAHLGSNNARASTSSYGEQIQFSAPGSSINSTMPGGLYGSKSGTSMAAPHVTGVVALLLAQNPNLTLEQLRQKLRDGALDVNAAGWDQYTGWGLVQAAPSLGGGAAPPPVPLALSVSPGSARVSAQQGASVPGASATVTLAGDGATVAQWTAAKRKSWTMLVTGSGIGNGSVSWSRSTAGLAPGTYVDTITITASGATGSPARVIDTLVVTAAPVPLALAVSPSSRRATAQEGAAAPTDSATITLSGDGSASKSWSAAKRKSWTTLTAGSGTGSGMVRWSRNTAGLLPGTYVDTITITASGATGSPARVIDTLVVTAAPVPLALAVSPSSRRATAQEGAAAPTDSATITLSGDGSASKSWSAAKRKSWTTLTAGSGTGSGMVRWSRSTAGLAPGTYVDTITVTASGATGSPTRVIDTLVVTAAPVPLALAVSPSSRRATAQEGTAAPTDSATITLSGDGSASKTWSAAKRKSWTTLVTGSGTGSGMVRWSRSTAGLAPGTYVDTITVTASGATGSPARVIDTLVITAPPVPLAVAVSPGFRRASAQQGTPAPGGTATVTITGDGASAAAWSAAKRKSWTTLVTGSGTGSGSVSWTRSTAGLAPGTYVDTITVAVAGATGSPARVIDTLVITAVPVPLALDLSPESRRATAQQGSAAPGDSAAVTLSGDGAAAKVWTVTKRKSWTTLAAGGGTGSGMIRWSRNTAGLLPGTYVDTITVTASGAVGSPARVIDTLVITAIPVPLAISVTPASRFTSVEEGKPASGASAAVALSGDGASTTSWNAARRKPWTAITAGSGTGNGTVSWTRSTAGLAPGTYVDTITVTAAGGGGIAARVIDTMVVTRKPVPLAAMIDATSFRVTAQQGSAAPAGSAELTLTGDGADAAAWTVSRRRSWNTLTAGSGTGSGTIGWTRSTAGLALGTHVDTITVTVSGLAGGPIRVIDSLVITAAPVPLALAVSPGTRKTVVQQGSAAPGGTAAVSISGTGAAAVSWTAARRSSWTVLGTTSGTGSGTLSWSRNTAALAPGIHVDTISVTASGIPSPAQIIDSIEVTALAAPLVVAAAPTSWNVQVLQGGTAPSASASVTISGTGAPTAEWQATKKKSWTTLTAAAGTGNGTVAWSRNVAGLAPGIHVDTITVAIVGGSALTRIVDTVTVTAPAAPSRTVAFARRGSASRVVRMTGSSGSSVLPGEVALTVTGDAQRWTATSTGSWIQLQSAGGTGSATIRWQRNSDPLPVGRHVDTIAVRLDADPSVVAYHVDTLEVVLAPVPTPQVAVTDLLRGGAALSQDQRLVLDAAGNRNGRYDLGDFLAWVRRSNIRLSASMQRDLMSVQMQEQR